MTKDFCDECGEELKSEQYKIAYINVDTLEYCNSCFKNKAKLLLDANLITYIWARYD